MYLRNTTIKNSYDLVNPKYLEYSKINNRMLEGKKAEMTQILKIEQTLNLYRSMFQANFCIMMMLPLFVFSFVSLHPF